MSPRTSELSSFEAAVLSPEVPERAEGRATGAARRKARRGIRSESSLEVRAAAGVWS